MNLKDKIVVITGGTKGLGLSLALACQRAGSLVVVAARSTSQDLPIGILPLRADVTSEKDLADLAKKVAVRFGRIDVWINNAGIWTPHVPIETLDLKRVRAMIEVNLFGVIHGAKAALIQMREQGAGTIINILSASALEGVARSSGYVASKYAAKGFAKSLRLEAESDGIKVINVYPAGMKTAVFSGRPPVGYDKYMEPDNVAEMIVANLEDGKPEEEQIIKSIGK